MEVTEETSGRPKSVAIDKPVPYAFDLGNLICNDENLIPENPTSQDLAAIARDCAQATINQLLTTCKIKSTSDGVSIVLPSPTTSLPREKPLPAPKGETTWERFAKKKGIKAKKRGEGRTVYDEATGEWVPKWGYKGKNKGIEDDWIVEVDAKKDQALDHDSNARTASRKERVERVRRNERKQRANERRTRGQGSS